jgi:hypothetical protein
MKVIAALPVLIAFLVGALPAHAWTWPVAGPVLQPFQIEGNPYAAGQHRGVDIGAGTGTPVVAPAAGVVSFAGTVPGGGRTVTIRTADGYAVTLLHLGAIEAARGATVAEGAPVGTAGTSGEAEHAEAYVHLGIRVASDPHGYVDPESLLPARPASPRAEETEAPQPPVEAPTEAPAAGEHPAPEPETPEGETPPGETQTPAGPEAEAPDESAGDAEPAQPAEDVRAPIAKARSEGEGDRDPGPGDAPGLPAAAPMEHVHPAAWEVGAPSPAERSRDTRAAPAAPTTIALRAAPSSSRPHAQGDATSLAQSGRPLRSDDPAPPAAAPETVDEGGQWVATALAVAAALALHGAVLVLRKRRGGVAVEKPLMLGSEQRGDGAEDEPPGGRSVVTSSTSDVDAWLAELLSPRAPCPGRLTGVGRRHVRPSGPRRGRPVTRSRAVAAQVGGSARGGSRRPATRSRS